MLKKLLLPILIGYAGLAGAQGTPFLNDANGRPVLTNNNNFTADGSPFLFDEYYPAEITFQTGKVYKDVKTKVNLSDNELLFMDDKGNELMASAPVKSVKLLKSGTEILLESPGGVINTPRSQVYQVLVNKKAKLLKQIAITFTEARKYGEGGMTRTYKKKETYYAAFPGQAPQKFDKDKTAVAAVFGAKQAQIRQFIDDNKLRCKNDEDFIKIFDYFDALN